MLPYFVYFFFIALLALSSARLFRSRAAAWVCFASLVVFVGCRDQVGMDWNNYLAKFEFAKYQSFASLKLHREGTFELINWYLARNGYEFYLLNVLLSIPFAWGITAMAWTTRNPWLAVVVVFPYLIVAVGMSGIRQAAAIGVFMAMHSRWDKLTTASKVAFGLLAFSFHASAFFIGALIAYGSQFRAAFRWPLLAFLLIGSTYFFFEGETSEVYRQVYIAKNLASAGAFAHVMLGLVPALIYFLWKKRFDAVDEFDRVMKILCMAAILAAPGLLISSTGVDRLSLYCSAIQMKIYGAAPGALGTPQSQRAFTGVVIGVMGVILWVWLTQANSARAYASYDSVLFRSW